MAGMGNFAVSEPWSVQIKSGVWHIGDTFDVMRTLPSASVDMILCDLPYGTTANKWDSVLPLPALWAEYRRVCKPNAAIVLTAAQPFTSVVVSSNYGSFKQELIWAKNIASDFMNAGRRHMAKHESVLLFSDGKPPYNPQLSEGAPYVSKRTGRDDRGANYTASPSNSFARTDTVNDGTRKPTSLLAINVERGFHPTQKPVALFEYLIRTYTNPGDTVLDNTAGSGTTAVAAEQSGRRWICIERDEEYSFKAIARLA